MEKQPPHVRRDDYPSDVDYAAAKVAFYSFHLRQLWAFRSRPVYRRQSATWGDSGIPVVRFIIEDGRVLTARQDKVMIYPNNQRLMALWFMQDGDRVDSHYNHALPFGCVADMIQAN